MLKNQERLKELQKQKRELEKQLKSIEKDIAYTKTIQKNYKIINNKQSKNNY